MAILWCGGEDIDFEVRPTGVEHYSTIRTGYSRCSLRHSNAYTIADAWSYPAASPVTSCWFTVRDYSGAFTVGRRVIGIGRKGYVGGLWLKTDASNAYKLTLCKRNESGTDTQIATESGASLVASAAVKFDVQVESFGATGRVRVYLDGAGSPVIDTGAGGTDLTWTSGPTNLDRIGFFQPTSGALQCFGEFILADEDSRQMSLVTLAPNGAGAGNTFTSGAYGDLAESSPYQANDATIVSSDTTGQHAEFALSNLPAGTFTIKAVKVAVRGIRGASGIQQIKIGIRDNVSGINVDAGHALAVTFSEVERLMLTNPAAARAWDQADIDPMQIALESLT